MSDVATLIQQAEEMGAVFEFEDADHVRVRAAAPLDDAIMSALRERKREVMAHLKLRGYRHKYPDPQATRQELEEIAQTVEGAGFVLLWSKELSDLIAFYRDEEAKSEIPLGFVPYSVKELGELFGDNPVSDHELRLIHEAKKHGHVISREGNIEWA